MTKKRLADKLCCEHGVDFQHKIGGMLCRNGKVLSVKKRGKREFIITGGGHEKGETFEETVKREFLEEVQLDVEVGESLGFFKAKSMWEKGNTLCHIYLVSSTAQPIPSNEIVEYRWIDTNFKNEGIEIGSIFEFEVLPILKQKGLIH